MITGDALQEDIAGVLSSCYERGQRIGGVVPWMPAQESRDERSRTDYAEATEAHTGTVQLGRSSPGA
jgi:hypothetical protein